eukprot:724572-Prymnesium_polylepis.2
MVPSRTPITHTPVTFSRESPLFKGCSDPDPSYSRCGSLLRLSARGSEATNLTPKVLQAAHSTNRHCFDSEMRVTPSFAMGPILPKRNYHVKIAKKSLRTTAKHPLLSPGECHMQAGYKGTPLGTLSHNCTAVHGGPSAFRAGFSGRYSKYYPHNRSSAPASVPHAAQYAPPFHYQAHV